MTIPLSAVTSVEVITLEFSIDRPLMEEKLAEYLLKGFTIESVVPSTWKTMEKPAAFTYWETTACSYLVFLVKRDFEVKTQSADTVKNAVTEGMKKRNSK